MTSWAGGKMRSIFGVDLKSGLAPKRAKVIETVAPWRQHAPNIFLNLLCFI